MADHGTDDTTYFGMGYDGNHGLGPVPNDDSNMRGSVLDMTLPGGEVGGVESILQLSFEVSIGFSYGAY